MLGRPPLKPCQVADGDLVTVQQFDQLGYVIRLFALYGHGCTLGWSSRWTKQVAHRTCDCWPTVGNPCPGTRVSPGIDTSLVLSDPTAKIRHRGARLQKLVAEIMAAWRRAERLTATLPEGSAEH